MVTAVAFVVRTSLFHILYFIFSFIELHCLSKDNINLSFNNRVTFDNQPQHQQFQVQFTTKEQQEESIKNWIHRKSKQHNNSPSKLDLKTKDGKKLRKNRKTRNASSKTFTSNDLKHDIRQLKNNGKSSNSTAALNSLTIPQNNNQNTNNLLQTTTTTTNNESHSDIPEPLPTYTEATGLGSSNNKISKSNLQRSSSPENPNLNNSDYHHKTNQTHEKPENSDSSSFIELIPTEQDASSHIEDSSTESETYELVNQHHKPNNLTISNHINNYTKSPPTEPHRITITHVKKFTKIPIFTHDYWICQ